MSGDTQGFGGPYWHSEVLERGGGGGRQGVVTGRDGTLSGFVSITFAGFLKSLTDCL